MPLKFGRQQVFNLGYVARVIRKDRYILFIYSKPSFFLPNTFYFRLKDQVASKKVYDEIVTLQLR